MTGKKEWMSGSPVNGEPAFLAIGKVRRPHGVHGEMVVELITDFPERFRPDATLYVGEKHLPLILLGSRYHNEGVLVAFVGISTPEEAGQFRNQVIYTSMKSLPDLAEGEYYFHQLIGLSVETDDGIQLGTITTILETGANDVYVVETKAGGELLLPAIPEVILAVDLKLKLMRVHMIPGLDPGTAEEA